MVDSNFFKRGLLVLFMLFSYFHIFSQCPTGSEPGCQCETADVVCSALDLDGYQFSMTNYYHPWDGPGPFNNSPICGEPNSVANNPTWFAFTAWCSDLTLLVEVENCSGGSSTGAQIAIYDGCGADGNCIASAADGTECGNENDKSISMNSLIVGQTLYFLIDGCGNSACDVTISVLNTCGPTEIEDWTQDIMGPEVLCVGEEATYTGELLSGANVYHWTIDGGDLFLTKEDFFTTVFDTPGTYELCLDASNEPCIDVSADPDPTCITIEVVEADAGEIMADPESLCPGETSTVTITDPSTLDGIEQYLIIVGPDGTITEITDQLTTTVTHPECAVYTAYSVSFSSGSLTVPSVGDPFTEEFCTVECCDLVSVEINFEDTEAPEFVDAPEDITLACLDDLTPMTSLSYTDNCAEDGTVDGVEAGGDDPCDPGTITRTWTAVDDCGGNEQIHVQTITIEIDDESIMFTDAPENVTIACYDMLPAMDPLAYTDVCLGAGTITGVETGDADICDGGEITRTWTVTSDCDVTFTHVQVITVSPTVAPTFTDAPEDITMTCDEYSAFTASPLAYANMGAGGCETMGQVDPTVDEMLANCEGTVEITWEFTDACDNMISHKQVITVQPPAEADYVDPPADETLSCEDLIMPDMGPDLNYTNEGVGDCLIEGTVEAVEVYDVDACGGTITYTWETQDDCLRDISHTQVITIDPAPEATFMDPPSDEMITCDEFTTLGAPADLAYSNGGTDACEISGTVSPMIENNASTCGGEIVYTWTFTDACDREISHVQTITVEPAPLAMFLDAPADMSVTCEEFEALGDPPMLMYSNGVTDGCELSGSVDPMIEDNVTICGGEVTYTWTFVDPCDNEISHVQTITVEPAPEGMFMDTPSPVLNLSCEDDIEAPSALTFTNGLSGDCAINVDVEPVQNGEVTSCGGTLENVWEYRDECDRVATFTQTVNVTPAPIATPTTMPGEITIDCSEKGQNPDPITFDNGISGLCGSNVVANGVRTGNVGLCGGVMMDVWTATDVCGNVLTYQRTVNVNPAPPADFVDAPDPITVDCIDLDDVPTTLDYTNGESGNCSISGTIDALVSGSADACGGDLTYTWTFTDDCNRTITYSQNITVNPAPEPTFIDPPGDMILGCEDQFDGADDLEYNNGLDFDCNISGFAVASTSQVDNIITNEWEFISPCTGEVYTHTQVITASIAPDIEVSISEIYMCFGDSYDLNDIEVTNVNGTDITITFHDDVPPDAGNQIDDIDTPNGNGEYVIRAVNQFGCEDYEVIDVYLEDPPEAGDDNTISLCGGATEVYDLYDFLSSDADIFGEFFDLDGIGVSVWDADEVSFASLSNGTYNLYYITEGFEACPNDTMILTIEVFDELDYSIDLVECSADNNTYNVTVNTSFDVTSTGGSVTDNGDMTYTISGIPISQTITITIADPAGGCSTEVEITPPNCDCPNIAAPEGDDYTVCINEQPLTIGVAVPAGMTANWYDAADPAVSILDGSLTYIVDGLTAGTHDFLVETYDVVSGCTSNIKTTISVTIIALPVATEINIELCDVDGDGEESVTLSDYKNMVNGSPTSTVTFYGNMADAESGTGALDDNHTLVSTTSTLYTRVVSANGCVNTGIANFTLLDLPTADVTTVGVACIGDTNGSITVTSLGGSLMTSLDGVNFTSDLVYNDVASGQYVVYIQDENGCINSYPTEVEAGFEMSITSFEEICNSNGTNTDETDDFYDFEFLIENNQGNAGTYIITIDGTDQGPFNYGEASTFEWPADGSSPIVTITDVTSDCSLTEETGPLVTCSTDCQITINTITYECNDNGTGTDPSDDYYDVTINVSAINGGNNGMYNVFLDNVLTYSFAYDTDETFQVPVNENDVTVTVQDNQIVQCEATTTLVDLISCSNDCQIDMQIISADCDSNGTPTDTADDFYTITINGTILNGSPSSYSILVDNVEIMTGSSYDTDVSFNVPADGAIHVITIVDADDSDCTATVTTEELVSCSTDCILNHDIIEIECDDNNTPFDATDDFYVITFSATSVNGASSYDLSIGGNPVGTYNYGETYMTNVPADGSSPTIQFVDSEDDQCRSNEVLPELVTCSGGCMIEIEIVSSVCDNNGTPLDPSDDTWEITYIANAVNPNSTNYTRTVDGIEGNTLYAYGETFTITFNADNNVHTFSLEDATDEACVEEYVTDVLAPCVEDCDLIISLGEPECDFNGTNDDETDDTFTVEITVTNSSAGTFTIDETSDAGTYNTPIALGPFDIAAGNFTLTIIDDAIPECNTTVEVTPPPSCSSCSQTADAGTGGVISCSESEVTLTGTSSEPGDYHWYNQNGVEVGNDLTTTVSGVGTFYFEVEFSDGCVAIDSVVVTADEDLPTAIIVSGGDLTCLKSATILDGSQSGSEEDFNYFWYDGDGNLISEESMIQVEDAGVYSLQVQNIVNDCLSGIETVEIASDTEGPDAVIYAEPSTIIDCVIESIILTTEDQENVDYTWLIDGQPIESEEIEVSETGTYGLTAIDTITGCSNLADIIISSLIEYPIFSLSADDIDCDHEEIQIVATIANTSEELEGYWQNENGEVLNDTDFELDVNEAGTYYYTLTDNENGCVNTDTIVVNDNSADVEINVTPQIQYTSGSSVFLVATTDIDPSEIDTVYWTPNVNMDCPDCLRTNVSPPTTDEYTITVVDIYGCIGTNTIRLEEIAVPVVSVPNIFSNDGSTNVTVYGNEEVEQVLEFDIFDRWGNKVFTGKNFPPNDPTLGWNGRYRDQHVQQGVFVYRALVEFKNGETQQFLGDITVLR